MVSSLFDSLHPPTRYLILGGRDYSWVVCSDSQVLFPHLPYARQVATSPWPSFRPMRYRGSYHGRVGRFGGWQETWHRKQAQMEILTKTDAFSCSSFSPSKRVQYNKLVSLKMGYPKNPMVDHHLPVEIIIVWGYPGILCSQIHPNRDFGRKKDIFLRNVTRKNIFHFPISINNIRILQYIRY